MNAEFIVLAIFVPLVVGLLTNEFSDWLPIWAEKIVVRTARGLPAYIQERYKQDWLADLDDYPTGFSKLIFAFGLRFGVRLLREEHERFLEIEYGHSRYSEPRVFVSSQSNPKWIPSPLIKSHYLKRATRRFLKGTRFKSPVEAVESGSRTVDMWLKIVEEERLRSEINMRHKDAG
jgi:hypothetical protein